MISNLLDIDFIHDDIHGQLCKDKYVTWIRQKLIMIWWITAKEM